MIFDKHRFEVWTQVQHPYKHSLSDFAYSNPGLPGVSDVNSALNWAFKVLYPNTKPAVATVPDLPAGGNTINDYRVVQDDGDGKSAAYRWEQREGDVSAKWYKVMDMDWSTDSILASFLEVTQDLYVVQKGKQDIDFTGSVLTGIFAGQNVFGGTQANQNLTLHANSGDGTGPRTGYVQVNDNFRPTVTNIFDIGTGTIKFKDLFLSGTANIGTMAVSSGSIVDSSGAISFSANNLSTTGFVSATNIIGTTNGTFGGTLVVTGNSIINSGGSISFGSNNLTTTGTSTAAAGSVLADLTFGTGSITSGSGAITFGAVNLSTTGTLSAGNTTVPRIDSGNVRITGNTISVLNANGNLIVQANGTGVVDFQSAMTTLGITSTGVVSVTGQLNADNLRFDGNVISSTNLNGNIVLTPNGTGIVEYSAALTPNGDNSVDIGNFSRRIKDLYMAGNFYDATNSIATSTLMSFRDALVGVSAGMTLFYDGSKWLPSFPDTEIVHNTLSGLTTSDAGHTQFVMLTGRAGGQTVQGGTSAADNLVLESTLNASKGQILFKDILAPFTDASFSGSWSGTDLGATSKNIRDVYTKGEFFGLRLENKTAGTLPASSAQNVGRLVFETDTKKVKIDTGSAFVPVGVSKYQSDTSWNGVQLTQTFTVSASLSDARTALWQLCDNANNFDRIYCTIQAISATQVTVETGIALPAGSYRLIGLE